LIQAAVIVAAAVIAAAAIVAMNSRSMRTLLSSWRLGNRHASEGMPSSPLTGGRA
jgi:hypothetical protein